MLYELEIVSTRKGMCEHVPATFSCVPVYIGNLAQHVPVTMAMKLWENVHLSFGKNKMKFDLTEDKYI